MDTKGWIISDMGDAINEDSGQEGRSNEKTKLEEDTDQPRGGVHKGEIMQGLEVD